jgi:hypothetical protein
MNIPGGIKRKAESWAGLGGVAVAVYRLPERPWYCFAGGPYTYAERFFRDLLVWEPQLLLASESSQWIVVQLYDDDPPPDILHYWIMNRWPTDALAELALYIPCPSIPSPSKTSVKHLQR